MVTLPGRPAGSSCVGQGSGSGSGVGQLHDQTQEFICSEFTFIILERTPMIFGTAKEDIMMNLDGCLSSFRSEMVPLIGVHSSTFTEFQACEAPVYYVEKDPIESRRWLPEVSNAFWTTSFPEWGKGHTCFMSFEG